MEEEIPIPVEKRRLLAICTDELLLRRLSILSIYLIIKYG
jgi:hypothetical protein